ncbi:transporter substrate-binding domain-containing protein [Pseudodesulfovibrio cashew]|uniref:Transporter substrate-binding domain-containing protein n=1 Tax=Pseudodesulfovibrio cashew TaxID=2678688 RepID=A0A6I6JGV7_9BACT|nr:transporter substrate-binding domain-containing protein [Pseudodesulfovibrio cashew]QGY39602.1 transporter substrate-binding domain-containing protein [Pseudodesulfovibrio cashew]
MRRFAIAPALALILGLILMTLPARAQRPVFAANLDFAPYSMLVDGVPAGIDVDVINEAALRAGLDLDIRLVPWDELVSMVKNGQCDGGLSFFQSPERLKYSLFMEAVPLHVSNYVLFTKVGDKFPFQDYADLKGKVIGRASGTDLGPDFAAAEAAAIMTVKDYPDLAAALRGLLLGEIDAYAGNIDVTYYRLKDMGLTSSVVYLPKKILANKPAYLVMSRASALKDKELLLQQLELALDKMRKDGTYNRIARKYLLRF